MNARYESFHLCTVWKYLIDLDTYNHIMFGKKKDDSSSGQSVADELAKIAKLKEQGILSEDEFTKMKQDLINKM